MVEQADPVKRSEQSKKIAKEAAEWAEKQKLLQLSEISLILDTYDDLFSDFDPRTLDKRSLSEDFLSDIKRATKEKKSGVIELNFLIPLEQKKEEKEAMIRKRLHEHFRKHYELIQKEVQFVRTRGIIMVVVGVILSILTAVFVYPHVDENVFMSIVLILIEPAAWFTIWEGANKFFDGWKYESLDLEFYKKMVKCEVSFTGY